MSSGSLQVNSCCHRRERRATRLCRIGTYHMRASAHGSADRLAVQWQ